MRERVCRLRISLKRNICRDICDEKIIDIKDRECFIGNLGDLIHIVSSILRCARLDHLRDYDILICVVDRQHLNQRKEGYLVGIEYCFEDDFNRESRPAFDLFIIVRAKKGRKYVYYCFCIECTMSEARIISKIRAKSLQNVVSLCKQLCSTCNCSYHNCSGKLIILTTERVRNKLTRLPEISNLVSSDICCIIGV